MAKQATATIGHNSNTTNLLLKNTVDQIEKYEDERSIISRDISEAYKAAKGQGLDAKVIRKMIAERKIPDEKLTEQYELLDLYKCAYSNASI